MNGRIDVEGRELMEWSLWCILANIYHMYFRKFFEQKMHISDFLHIVCAVRDAKYWPYDPTPVFKKAAAALGLEEEEIASLRRQLAASQLQAVTAEQKLSATEKELFATRKELAAEKLGAASLRIHLAENKQRADDAEQKLASIASLL
jgi:hypothetical protein